MPRPKERGYYNYLGEYYDDCLVIEVALKNRTKINEASSLICAKLMERSEKRKQMVQYLADKRGITFDDMWKQLLTGEYQPLSPDELKEIGDTDPSDG